ncbi:MAG TPA: formimidoylglutamate deiminase [Solirubrobacterales bacterium]|jgi:formiminoglutamate deiminase|nr:formimidoylglutamate deiminase [Solirubrobacterales bacterium]
MTDFWCEYAWLGGEEATPGVLVGVEGERIVTVRIGVAEAPAGSVTLTGYTLPGLANAHSHAFQRAFRGKTEVGPGTFWTWREEMYAAAARLDPDLYFALARATFGEMALAGVTSVGEFHYVHHAPDGSPYEDPNAMGAAVIAAAREAGIRITLLDTCYLHGGIGVGVTEGQRRFSDGTADRWAERVSALASGPAVRIGAAIHSVRAVSPEEATAVAEWAHEREAPLHAHVSEQLAENAASIAAYGRTPTEVLAEAGALGERFTAVHVTHPSERDRELLGAAGATVCLCPTTERNLADGIGPAAALRASGARLAVGSDSQAVIDLFEECRAIELDERLARLERGNQDAATLLAAATADGQRAIGWPEAGAIERGRLADLVNLSGRGVRLAGITPDTAAPSIVFAASAADVTNVIVGGEFVVRDGAHVRLDVASELRESIAALTGDEAGDGGAW